MRRGFTIIELLVASMLLGMLVTILTMIFNQSSIAWRTGVAGVADLDLTRDKMAEIREEADNAFIANNRMYRHVNLWDPAGVLRRRSCDAEGNTGLQQVDHVQLLNTSVSANTKPSAFTAITVGNGSAGSLSAYTVNVMSCGPDGEFDTWDDIWSYPDDPNQW